jgi:myo-inositol 2-dehydrogenase/D-chiro-inositol 1-dehydrogenase/scyllo-inositol 2-dehydrogenase (NAD+)
MIHARNFASGVAGGWLVAVADASAEQLRAAAAELETAETLPSWEAALEHPEVDAVVIATPTDLHRQVAVAAARRGKHILCEKPMAMNPAECDAMIEAAAEHGVVLQIGFMRRYDPDFTEGKNRVDRGEIGSVVLVKSTGHGPSHPKSWQYDLRRSNGTLAEVNSHDIDTLRWFTGSEFTTVYAIGGNFRCPEAREQYPDFYDNFVLVATFANGMQGVITGAASVGYAYDARVEIVGERGVVMIGKLAATSVVACSEADGIRSAAVQSWRTLFTEAYREEDRGFIRSILEGTPPRAGGIDGKRAVEVVNAGNQSIREGRPVTL